MQAAPVARSSEPHLSPLCVDLDGTLVRSDTLVESIFSLPLNRRLVGCVAALLGGRAKFKKHVAQATSLDVSTLPYNEKLLAYLQQQKDLGRALILATAADILIARRVAGHLGIFDDVIASDGGENVKGAVKARILSSRFGAKEFAYAGNSRADLAVWRAAKSAVVVNASAAVASAALQSVPLEAKIDERRSAFLSLVRAMRPHQWTKNILIFLPIVTAHAVADVSAWGRAFFAFMAFCATASAIYLVNDISDLSADRRHARKRKRAFAAGRVPLHVGALAALALLSGGLTLAVLGRVLPIICVYTATSIVYSAKLKKIAVLDVFVLAGLYTIRLFAGGSSSGYAVSFWLSAFSIFIFLSLALIKRVAELKTMQPGATNMERRGYRVEDLSILQTFGCGAALAAALVLALFIQAEATIERYATPGLLWGLVPLILFWQFRMWLITSRGKMRDDPITFAASDWVTWLVAASCLVILAVAKAFVFH